MLTFLVSCGTRHDNRVVLMEQDEAFLSRVRRESFSPTRAIDSACIGKDAPRIARFLAVSLPS